MKLARVIFAAAFVVAGIGSLNPAVQVQAQEPDPAPTNQIYLPVVERYDEAELYLDVPPGFSIATYSTGISGRPRMMSVGPDGYLYVSLTDGGKIARIPDANNDGFGDSIDTVATGLVKPNGMEWYHDASLGWVLYVAEDTQVSRLRGQNSSGAFQNKDLILDNIPSGGTNGLKTLHIGPDNKLYISVGSSENVVVESNARRATLLRVNLDGSIPADNPYAADENTNKRAVYVTGLRWSADFDWTSGNTLWANSVSPDGYTRGDAVAPEEVVNVISSGKYYGYPYCYTPYVGNIYDQASGARYEKQDTRMSSYDCAGKSTPALYTVKSQSNSQGMNFAYSSNFPSEYQDDMFVVLSGTTALNSPNLERECTIARLSLNGETINGIETFMTGWKQTGAHCGAAGSYGRPAGLLFYDDPTGTRTEIDGQMFISDESGGRIYRIYRNN